MNSPFSAGYLFRKSPLARTLCWVVCVAVLAAALLLTGYSFRRAPAIEGISPPSGSPGEVVVITGRNFGDVRDTGGYVEFAGNRLTSGSYLSWNDTEIRVVLPANLRDGLVVVGTKGSRSNPSFFVNAESVPVALAATGESSVPVITALRPERPAVGQLLTLSGSNFGGTREKSRVFFSAGYGESGGPAGQEDGGQSVFIAANSGDFDYVYWSDSEIRVYVPDGAASGTVYVETAGGKSAQSGIVIDSRAGEKRFLSPKSYLVQVSVDIEDFSGDKDSAVVLRCPRPQISASQPSAELTECSPEPVIPDFRNTVIHQLQGGRASSGRRRFTHNFAVSVYETNTSVNPKAILPYSAVNDALVANAVKADECVPSDHEAVRALAARIAGGEKNPYTAAKLIYEYMADNFKVSQKVRSGDVSSLDMLRTKKGDAYDFAVLYAALLRASGIPALPDSGVLVGQNLKTQKHWWCEFYIPGLGWIPSDPALGAGLSYYSWTKNIDARSFYFGNLDAQHILFSRGWNELKPGSNSAKTVRHPRSFALQSFWEEVTGKTSRYSCYWADPVVLGVY